MKDQPLLRQQVADKSEALVHSGRTGVEVAYFASRIVGLVGMHCNRRRGFDSWGRILLFVVCSKATAHCQMLLEVWSLPNGDDLLGGIQEEEDLY